MNPNRPSPEQIRNTAARMNAQKSAYGPILDFYGEIFVAQEQSRDGIAIPPFRISEEMLSLKTREQFPLISVSEFQLDMERSEKLLEDICELAVSLGGSLGPDARALQEVVKAKRVETRLLFFAVIEREGFDLGAQAQAAGISGESAAFLAYHSIRPSLVECAEQLAGLLKPEDWKKGYCPVCGSPPVLSVLKEQGSRSLICSFCWHEWPSTRIFCPFCETREGSSLHHFFDKENPTCRVDLCDGCRKYIKTADIRERDHLFYPPLEQVSTLHLDIKAQEMDYTSGSGAALPA